MWKRAPGTQTMNAPQVVWLQRRQIVNDESFAPFAIIPQSTEIIISLARDSDNSHHPVLVSVGISASLIGFVFQFIELRNLHWGVSVAQLVAMFLTTALRVFIRLPITRGTNCIELKPNFELEWLAQTIVGKDTCFNPICPKLKHEVQEYDAELSSLVRARVEVRKMSGDLG
jgi:hypothetical protein